MVPSTQPRKPRNSSKVNLVISVTFHGVILVALLYFAAREGLLGKQIKKIAVEMVKEKPVEKPKEPEKPKVEPPKIETPKVAEKIEPPKEVVQTPPPNAGAAPPSIAPAAVDVPSFNFAGGKTVETSADPNQLYKGLIEYALRSRWARPNDIADDSFVAEVEVAVSHSGDISDPVWKKNSGNKRWDDSVRQALATTSGVNHAPPSNFPPRVTIRFDVVESEPAIQ